MTKGVVALFCCAAFSLATSAANADEEVATLPAPPPAPTAAEGHGPWPYVLLATGATLAMSSAVFQLVAINEDSDAQNYFWHSTRTDLSAGTRDALERSSESHFDAAKTDQAIAITCGILAVTAVSAAVTWLLVSRH